MSSDKLVSVPNPALAIMAKLASVTLCENIAAEWLDRPLTGTDLLALRGFGRDSGSTNSTAEKDLKMLFKTDRDCDYNLIYNLEIDALSRDGIDCPLLAL